MSLAHRAEQPEAFRAEFLIASDRGPTYSPVLRARGHSLMTFCFNESRLTRASQMKVIKPTRFFSAPPRESARARAAMALAALSGDEHGTIFSQLCNVLDPGVAVAFCSASNELRELTQAPRLQLRADHEAATALGRKAGMQSCKVLREAKSAYCKETGLSADDLATLGTLGSVLPALQRLVLREPAAGPDGVQRMVEGLGTGALPAVTFLSITNMHVGDAGASALATALGQGALPRLKILALISAAIGDAGLVALAPALRWRPALERLYLTSNPFGDEGLAALVAPPPPAGAPPTPTAGLAKLKLLDLSGTQITDAGCAALAAALDSGALHALEDYKLALIPASAVAKLAVLNSRAPVGLAALGVTPSV